MLASVDGLRARYEADAVTSWKPTPASDSSERGAWTRGGARSSASHARARDASRVHQGVRTLHVGHVDLALAGTAVRPVRRSRAPLLPLAGVDRHAEGFGGAGDEALVNPRPVQVRPPDRVS